jgi:cytidylate kinase
VSNVPVIAVDGPSGTGKGTLCQLLAARLNWHLLDSGALYRVLAENARLLDTPLDDESALEKLALNLDVRFEEGTDPGAGVRVFLMGLDVTDSIRTETAGEAASRVAALPAVRQALLHRQHNFRQAPGLIADGRDMGTVVFPDAPLKVFLTASQQERAERRYRQLKMKDMDVSLPQLFDDIAARDDRDQNRSVSPLKAAEDAVEIDTTHLDITQVLEQVLNLVSERHLSQ